jgi:nicotinamide mononucleotide transporter
MNKWIVAYGAATLLTALCFAIGLPLGWLQSLNWIEVVAVFTSFACTILCNYQSRWNYPIGILSQCAYAWVFYSGGLYALAAFNLYLVFSLTYGFLFWKDDTNTVPVTSVKGLKSWLGYASFGILILALFYGSVYIIEPSNFATISQTDAALAALSGVAQLLLDRKKLHSWVLWAIINIISIPYYYSLGYYFFAFQYVFFLANTVIGFAAWYKSMDKSNVSNSAGDLLADRSDNLPVGNVGIPLR